MNTQLENKTFYPAKCPICYYAGICDHKEEPSPTKGCYTHKPDCEIYAGSNPTTGIEGNCTCGFKTFDFNKYFFHYYEKLQWSKNRADQPSLTVFCQNNAETRPVDAPKNYSSFAEKKEK